MQILENRYLKIGLFALIITAAGFRAFQSISLQNRAAEGYDEQMWTSASISAYNMYFKGHIRPTKELDNWFPTYAWIHEVDIFDGSEPRTAFNPDTVHFPYDFITIKGKGQEYSAVVKYDTLKFPREEFQYFDRASWTFGWKAPNLGKYIMGWFVDQFAAGKPDPNGYFRFYLPVNHAATKANKPEEFDSLKYVPSTVSSTTSFSYAPPAFVYLARIPNAIFTILIVALVFSIGWIFIAFWPAAAGAIWLLFNADFFEVNTAVGLDSFAAFFTTLGVLLVALTLREIRENRSWWKTLILSTATGMIIGMAISSKLNAGVLVYIVIACFVPAGIMVLFSWWKKNKWFSAPALMSRLIVSGGIIALLSVTVFVHLNPQVQGQTSKKIAAMRESINDYFTRRARIITQDEKRQNPRNYTNWLKLKDDFNMSLGLMMERVAYVKNPSGNYYGTIGNLLKFRFNFLDGLMAAIGLIWLFTVTRQGWTDTKFPTSLFVVLVSFALIFYGNTQFLWQDWSRYFTPVFPLYSLLIGSGALCTFEWARRKLQVKK